MRIVGMVMIALGILNVLGVAIKAIGAMALSNDIGRGVVAGLLLFGLGLFIVRRNPPRGRKGKARIIDDPKAVMPPLLLFRRSPPMKRFFAAVREALSLTG